VDQRERRLHPLVAEVRVVLAQLGREQHALVDDRARAEARDREVLAALALDPALYEAKVAEGRALGLQGKLAEAEAALRAGSPDVALLDVHLGGVDTRDLLARLRAAEIPVALVTGSANVDDFRGKADAVLAKPFTPDQLENAVADVLFRRVPAVM
jgi:CheY-like chemotaxis protein